LGYTTSCLSPLRYTSIGLQRVNPNLASLAISLFPPAIFIAVMALQLRYFKPTSSTRRQDRMELETSYSSLHLSALVPAALRNVVQLFQGEGEGEEDGLDMEEGPEGKILLASTR
jgi:hypothetical protein